MSSNIYKPYFGPTDFRMVREILRRAGYRLRDTAENRAAHLSAAKRLIQEFQRGRLPSKTPSILPRRHVDEESADSIPSWENEGGRHQCGNSASPNITNTQSDKPLITEKVFHHGKRPEAK